MSKIICIILFYSLANILSDVQQVVKSWAGGSEKFFTSIWSTHISSYETLRIHLCINPPPAFWRNHLEIALADRDDRNATYKSFLTAFLKGSGIPCPSLFADARVHFNLIVDLSSVDDVGF
jgi:hypothetical protein